MLVHCKLDYVQLIRDWYFTLQSASCPCLYICKTMTLRKAIEYKSFGVNFEELDNYALDELKLR